MTPPCPLCGNDLVLAKATDFGETYEYCRSCKKELSEMIALEVVNSDDGPDDDQLMDLAGLWCTPMDWDVNEVLPGMATKCSFVGPTKEHFVELPQTMCLCGEVTKTTSGAWIRNPSMD